MRLAAISVVALLLQGNVLASEAALIDGSDPAAVLAVAMRHGEARLAQDGAGDPLIEASAGGRPYRIAFLGCGAGQGCHAIRLSAQYAVEDIGDEDMDEWNREERFLTAVLSEPGLAELRMAIRLSGGVPEATLEAAFAIWAESVERFESHVGWDG